MKTKFKFKGVHHCDAVVLTCIDFRFWRETLDFLEKELGIETFDFPSLPGSSKAINECLEDDDLAMKCVCVPFDLHQAKKMVIVHHEDCGAYGGSGKFENREKEKEFHFEQMRKAVAKLKTRYPDKEYVLAYARLSDDGEELEFVTD